MNIVFCEPPSLSVQGDQVHRTRAPAAALAARGHRVITGNYLSARIQRALEVADVAVLVQCVDVDLVALVERRRRAKRITLVEINDDFTEPRAFGEVGSFYHQPQIQALIRELTHKADGLWTSTPELVRRFGHLNDHVLLVPNAAPAREMRAPRSTQTVHLGWAGSAGHAHDWPAFVPALNKLLGERPHLRFDVMAPAELRALFSSLPQEQLVWHAPRGFDDYMAFISQLDVGLAPLGQSAFARGRSDVKFLEYTQAGVAAVVSNGPAYQEVIAETGVLAATTPAEMMAHTARLLDDSALRERQVLRAQQWVARERTSQKLAERRDAFLRQLAVALPPADASATWPQAVEHVALTPSEQQLFVGLRQQAAPERAYPLFVAAGRDAPQSYLPELYAARTAPTPREAAAHRRRARRLQPTSVAVGMLELDALAQAQAWPKMGQLASVLLLELGPYAVLWHARARAATALGHQDAALAALREVGRAWPACPHVARARAEALIASLEQHTASDRALAARLASESAQELNSAIKLAAQQGALGMWDGVVLRARLARLQNRRSEALSLLAPALRAPAADLPELQSALALLAQEALALGNARAAHAALARLEIDVRDTFAALS